MTKDNTKKIEKAFNYIHGKAKKYTIKHNTFTQDIIPPLMEEASKKYDVPLSLIEKINGNTYSHFSIKAWS